MSAAAAAWGGRPQAVAAPDSDLPLAPAPRLLAFAVLGGLSAWCFAGLETHPPLGRVALVLLATVAGCAALARTVRIARRTPALALRLAVLTLTAWVALRAAGVPAHLLWPAHWSQLVGRLERGFTGLAGELWPYRGDDPASRLTLLLALPALLLPAGALAFWPGERTAATRRSLAFALLVLMFITATVNQPHASWSGRGAALLLAVALWLWLPRVARAARLGAVAWVASAGAVASLLVLLLHPAGPWIQFSHWDPLGPSLPPTTFQWDQLYGPLSWARSNEPMFEVAAPAPLLWKVTTLDRFDGIRFLRSAHPPGAPAQDNPPGSRGYVDLAFTLRGLRTRLLVGAGDVVGAQIAPGPDGRTGEIAPDGTVTLAGAPMLPGDSYRVSAYVPRATVTQLRRAPRGYPAAYLPFVTVTLPSAGQSGLGPVDLIGSARAAPDPARTIVVSRSGRGRAARLLARSPYARMRRLAGRLSIDASSPYDVASHIASFLRRNYVYDERSPRRRYPLESFLFGDGIGYCQQFSGAMALLLRLDGIPARVAVGFLPGRYDAASRRYRVGARDAHSWVEVYFAGIGWVPFDPTPPRPTGAPSIALPAFDSSGVAASLAVIGEHFAAAPRPRIGTAHRRARTVVHPRARRAGGSAGVVGIVMLALLGAGAGGLALLAGIAGARVRRGLRGQAEGAVGELRRALTRLEHGVGPGVTLLALAERLAATHGPEAARYVRDLAVRRYCDTCPPGRPSLRERRALRRALTAHGGAMAWLRGLRALPPALPGRSPSPSAAASSSERGHRR